MYFLQGCFIVAFYGIIIRCLAVSYTSISLVYFLLIACPMALIEMFAYFWLISSFLVTLLMAVLTLEFLILRATDVANKLLKMFKNNQVVRYNQERNRWLMMTLPNDELHILQLIRDIVKQFSVSSIGLCALAALIQNGCITDLTLAASFR